ncbi:MAG: rhodanese-related sulfurtransferase [Gammaproteobacteria bacterium]|jgi:rhodanese-related sulfurtransferase
MSESTAKYNGIEHQLLETLVPVNALTDDHLESLLRSVSIESVFSGQVLFSVGDYDNFHVYLLSGRVEIESSDGSVFLDADDPACRFALSHFQPRDSTAKAVTDCSVIRFNTDQLDSMLAWDQTSRYLILDIAEKRDLDEDADWMLTLLRSNLFYKIPPINIREILNKFEARYMSSGEVVLRQGEIGNGCYFIKEGVVGVYRATNERSSSELIAELGVGRCFGEDALVNSVGRNASVIMHSNGVLMKLKKQDFFLLLKQPAIPSLSFSEARLKLGENAIWIDVRTQDEYERAHLEKSLNLPLDIMKLKSRILDKGQQYITYCSSGRRSKSAAHFLTEEGFNVSALSDGIEKFFNSHKPLFVAS